MGEQRRGILRKRALAEEQSDSATSAGGHVLFLARRLLYIYISIHYIHPELRIVNYPFRLGKGAESL